MWAVYLAFAAAVFFYAANVPVRLAFTLRAADGRHALKVGVGAFNARYIVEPELALSRLRPGPGGFPAGAVRAAARAARYLVPRARAEGMRLSARIGAGDAARTALLWGAAMAACDALCVPARIEPDFSATHLALSGGGIVWLRLGHIMWAAAIIAMELAKGKVRQHGEASH